MVCDKGREGVPQVCHHFNPAPQQQQAAPLGRRVPDAALHALHS